MIIFIKNIMVNFDTSFTYNYRCILSDDFEKANNQLCVNDYIVIVEEKYMKIKKLYHCLYLYGKYKYIDFSELNNNFKHLTIDCKRLKYINLPHDICNINIYIDKSLKYLDILNIQQVDIDVNYIKNLVIKCKYQIMIDNFFDIDYYDINCSEKDYIYIPMLKSIMFE